MQGLFPASGYSREPYTPERIIVSLIYFKCCVPKASDRELARVIGNMTGHNLHHKRLSHCWKDISFGDTGSFKS